jgi:peptidoglycan/LPS O-acetylase OafA/YrhL
MLKTSARRDGTGLVTGVLSLRGLLALLVATAHVIGLATFCDGSVPVFAQPSATTIIVKIVCAIDIPVIFFVISGLAICRSLDRRAEFDQGLRTYATFIIRRILRLYPAHTVATLGVLVLAWLCLIDRPPIDFSAYPSLGIGFLPGWLNGDVFNPLKARTVAANFAILSWSMNIVVWSLYVEVCAIPVLPLFHAVCRRKDPVYDALMLAGLVLLALFFWQRMAVKYLFAFYLGMLVQTRGRDCARWLTRDGPAWPSAALAWVIMFGTCIWPAEAAINIFTQTACAFAIICLIVWRDDQRSFRLLEHPALYWNGRMSYSFYLWHYVLMTLVFRAVFAALSAAAFVQARWLIFAGVEIVSVAAALALAQLSYSYIEEPFIQWGARLEARWRRPAAAPARRPEPLGPIGGMGAQAAADSAD